VAIHIDPRELLKNELFIRGMREFAISVDKYDDIDKYTLKVSIIGIKINKILEQKA
ncbi:uncharacterized protein METZ01_LOCUS383253, partial [marine metagenome]